MEYYFYADLTDCNVSHHQMCKYFIESAEDIDLEYTSLYKINGDKLSITNPPSNYIKKFVFGKSKGYLYKFDADDLTENKLKILKNSLVMNIMGNISILPSSALQEKEVQVKLLKSYIKRNAGITKTVESEFPLLKDYEQYVNAGSYNVYSIFNKIKRRNHPYMTQRIREYITISVNSYIATKRVQELLCDTI